MRTKDEILNGTPLPIFLMKCRTDFKFFCEQCLGIKENGGIHDFQLKWFEAALKFKKLIIESGSGSSKTEIMGAAYPLWKMMTERNLKIILISKTLDQASSNILHRIKGYIQDNELLTEMFVPVDSRTAWNVTEIKTKNGHWVKNCPYNENIKGFRGHLIIADELDSYEDTNIFFEHVLSRLYPQGQVIGISTPVGPTRIIGQLKEKDKAGVVVGWHFIKTPYLVDAEGKPAKIENRDDIWNAISIWPEWWPLDKLHERWGDQSKSNWMRNYMCESLGEIDDAIFPIKNIVMAFDYKRGFDEVCYPDCMYFIGADFAISDGPKADFDAFVVVEKRDGMNIIKYMEKHKGLQRPQKVTRLRELFEKYYSDQGTYLVVDESNMGTMVMNDLRSLGVPVIGQNFHSGARKNLLTTLSSAFSGKGIVIPRNPDSDDECIKYSEELQTQLVGFRRKKSEKTASELIESRAAHDDIAMALAMAISESVKHEEMEVAPLSGGSVPKSINSGQVVGSQTFNRPVSTNPYLS